VASPIIHFFVTKFVYLLRWRIHKDDRTWQQRLDRTKANWDPILPALAAAYLKWKYPPTSLSDAQRSPPASPVADEGSTPLADSVLDFSIDVIDMYTMDKTSYIRRPNDSKSPAVDLALHGYIGNAPLSPSIAISMKTLELYHRLRLRKPSFSIEAFAKVICDLYSVSTLFCCKLRGLRCYRFPTGDDIAQFSAKHLIFIWRSFAL
jgi:hypothetical protein